MILAGEGTGISVGGVLRARESGFWNLPNSRAGGRELDPRSSFVREYVRLPQILLICQQVRESLL